MCRAMRVSIVIQRFAEGVTGGAEYHARRVGQHLAAAGHDVTVLTSTSRDARRWDNAFPPGESRDGALRVLRFPVRSRLLRDVERARESLRHALGRSPVTLRQAWSMWANPYVPELIAHVRDEAARYDAVLFFTYYYYPSLVGALHACGTARIGVPLGHDDDVFATPVVRRMLCAFDAMIANTDDERELIERVLGDRGRTPRADITVAGCGVDPPPAEISRPPIDDPYILYLGRFKDGLELLPEAWRAFRARYGAETFERSDGRTLRGDELTLVTVGDAQLSHLARGLEGERWKVVGHVDDAARWAWTRGCEVLINPSLYESLSLTLLEAWWVRRPALARAQCAVMASQIARAEGGATFRDAGSFADALAAMLRSREARARMGERGSTFAQQRYAWPRVMEHYARVLERCAQKKRK